MKFPSKDRIISSLPEPFFSIGIFLFMPKLYYILTKFPIAKQDETTSLLTVPKQGHITINPDGAKITYQKK